MNSGAGVVGPATLDERSRNEAERSKNDDDADLSRYDDDLSRNATDGDDGDDAPEKDVERLPPCSAEMIGIADDALRCGDTPGVVMSGVFVAVSIRFL